MTTYVPAQLTGEFDRLHAKKGTVGTPFSLTNPTDANLTDGSLLIAGNLGIGNLTQSPAADTKLHVKGADDKITQILFERGEDTPAPGGAALWVGIGTNAPKQILDVVEPDDAAYIWVRGGGFPGESYSGLEFIAGASSTGNRWQLAHRRVGPGSEFGDHDFHFTYFNGTSWRTKMAITTSGIVGIGTTTPAPSALLDVTSTTQGFLPPRMTTAQRDAIASPVAGLIIYNTADNHFYGYNGGGWKQLDN